MSNKDKHILEKQSLKDPFLSDAMDGFNEQHIPLTAMKRMDRRFFRLRNLWIKISLFLGISLACILVFHFYPLPKKRTATTIQSLSEIKHIPLNEIKSLPSIPKEKEILAEHIQQAFKEKDKGMVFQVQENPSFYSDEIVQLPLRSIHKIDRIPAQKRINFAMETYIDELKIIDYRYYRKKTRQEKSTLLTGTPAAQENRNSETMQKENLEVSYMNYLTETLSDFNKGEYKASLIGFDEILSTYPDDINALFYSALCLYNLKQFKLSEQRLKVIDLTKFDNFDEEQEWYLLLCYKALGDREEFDELKQQIINSNGFYARKAIGLNL